MPRQPLFTGLVVDENGTPAETAYVGEEPCYVVDDAGFRRHIPSEQVDRMVLSHDANSYMDTIPPDRKAEVMPNWHYLHITNDVLPALRQQGVSDDDIHKMTVDNPRRIFEQEGAYQCGFCSPGMIMELVDLLGRKPVPADAEIMTQMEGHLCRCWPGRPDSPAC